MLILNEIRLKKARGILQVAINKDSKVTLTSTNSQCSPRKSERRDFLKKNLKILNALPISNSKYVESHYDSINFTHTKWKNDTIISITSATFIYLVRHRKVSQCIPKNLLTIPRILIKFKRKKRIKWQYNFTCFYNKVIS